MNWKEFREFSRAQDMAKKQMEQHELDAEREALNRKPVSAELISVEYRQSTLEALGRAFIGEDLFGDIGFYAGIATTPERAKKATFRVKYASGRTGMEMVDVKSARFRELAVLLDD